jgi:hypothetical protein
MTYTINFQDAETPAVMGSNLVLQRAPNPPECLQLFRNGILQSAVQDYGLASMMVTPKPAPAPGEVWTAFYRW